MNAAIKIDKTGKLEIPAPKIQPSQSVAKKLTLEIEYDPETHQYVAVCPELDLATAGDREEEAIEDLVEAIKEYAQDYLERLDLFAGSPNRGAHLPLIFLIASCVSKADIRRLLTTTSKRIG